MFMLIIIKNGFQKQINELGYNINLNDLKIDNVYDNIIQDKNTGEYAAIRDACYFVQFGKKIQFKCAKIKIRSYKVGIHELRCVSNSMRFKGIFEKLVSSESFTNNFFLKES